MMFVDPTRHCAISKKTTTLPIAACDAPINVDVSDYGNGLGGADPRDCIGPLCLDLCYSVDSVLAETRMVLWTVSLTNRRDGVELCDGSLHAAPIGNGYFLFIYTAYL
jgi:hypothetical protein